MNIGVSLGEKRAMELVILKNGPFLETLTIEYLKSGQVFSTGWKST